MTSILKVSEIQDPTNSNTAFTIGTDGRPYPKAGGIVQIQYAQSTTGTSQAYTADTYVKLTNFPSVTITPVSTASTLMIDVMWNGEFGNFNGAWESVFMLYRDNTLIHGNMDTSHLKRGMFPPRTSYTSADNDSTPESASGRYFDTPSTTSAVTYYLGLKSRQTNTIYINRCVNNGTAEGYERMISNMTITEIAG